MSCRVLYLVLSVVLGFYATLVAADPGGVISVNFSVGDSTSLDSASVEGAVASRHWNNAISPPRRAGDGVLENLLDSSGALSGASFAFQAAYVNSNGNGKNGRMMDAWAANGAGDSPNSFSFRGVPRLSLIHI